jgi:hypothetical protein
MRVEVTACLLVTRFQNVVELRVREGRLHDPDPTAR